MCGFLTRLCRCKQRVEKPVLLFIKETNIIIKSLQKLLKIRQKKKSSIFLSLKKK